VTQHATEQIRTRSTPCTRPRSARQTEEAGGNARQFGGAFETRSTRSFWLEILEDLNARLPKEDIWVTELIPPPVENCGGGRKTSGRISSGWRLGAPGVMRSGEPLSTAF
jgi:hypothetical protein